MTCTRVLLPAPLGPMIATWVPASMVSDTSSSMSVPFLRTVACLIATMGSMFFASVLQGV